MSGLVWTPPTGDTVRPEFPGWRLSDYVPLPIIEAFATDTLTQFASRCGGSVNFPLDAELLVKEVFGLDVHYDDGTIMDAIDSRLVGALYPDGIVCPATGSDRVIMVNDAPRFQGVTTSFTILHEVGHLLLHHPLDATSGEALAYCRTKEALPTWSRVPPREWQAGRLAGEVVMPRELVLRVLDGIQPPDIVNLAVYGPRFREFFGMSQAAMEKRIADLGYSYVSGRYAFADVRETRASEG